MTMDSGTASDYITAQGRDLRLDLLRGYFVFAMVVDHVSGASPLWLLTGGNRFFAGAAEGFVLTSGLVAGLVYGRRIRRDGLGRSLMKVLSRVLTLYLLTLALTFILLPLSELLRLPWAQGVADPGSLSTIVSILTLHRTYYLVDVMLLYTVVFLLAPLALVLLEQGKPWWVLGASWLLWGLFQLWPDSTALPWPIAGNYLFSFAAWQVIFFSGLVLSYGRRAMPTPEPRKARLLLALTGVSLLLLVALFVAAGLPGVATPAPLAGTSPGLRALVENLFLDKANLRPGRLLATAIIFSFLYLAATVYWRPVRRALGWLLLPLGQQALYAYTAHVGLVVLAAIALAPLHLDNSAPQWLNAAIQVAAVALVWVLVRFQVLAPTPRTRRLYRLSPLPFAVLAVCAFHIAPVPANASQAIPHSANRFGTPLPPTSAPQRANRFGTPLPPTVTGDAPAPAAAATATPNPTAQPTPTPTASPAETSEALARVAECLGQINGRLQEEWFYSDALAREMPYWVYLPPGYDAAARQYPVLYMLHGAGGHRDEWICFGLIDEADREMTDGTLTPMIIVLPQGDMGFWVNNADGGPRWGDYVTQDLINQVDATYRTLPTREARAIGGLSMGGFGALTLAFTHPDTFGAVGAHAPSLHTESQDVAFLGSGDTFAEVDPLSLAGTQQGLDRLRIWIDIDAEDNWLERAQQLHETLNQRGIEHTWQVFPGQHEGDYWRMHITDYLRFYGSALVSG